jgi:hypothetical protein
MDDGPVVVVPEETPNLFQALCVAQMEFAPVAKDQVNPHFKSKYSSLDAINKATRPALSKNGLVIHNCHSGDRETPAYTTMLQHVSGEAISTTCPLYFTASMQSLGSAISYARRYNICGLLNVVSDEEDDGHAARHGDGRQVGVKALPSRPAPKPPTPAPPKPKAGIDIAMWGRRVDSLATPEEAVDFINKATEYDTLLKDVGACDAILNQLADHIRASVEKGEWEAVAAGVAKKLLLQKHTAIEMQRELKQEGPINDEDQAGAN